jgi:hypothetical protein
MANIFHMSVKVIQRSAGDSVIGAAAYRSGMMLLDERTNTQHDYTKKQEVDYSEILTPDLAPEWCRDRSLLWNTIEKVEKRKDAQLSRDVEIALLRDLTAEQNIELIRSYVKKEFVDQGMIADINIHKLFGDNPHVHILLTMRAVDQQGFKEKVRLWNSKGLVDKWRKSWCEHANVALAEAGHVSRIDNRTLAAQGITRVPQIHLGKYNQKLLNNGGTNERIEEYQRINEINDEMETVEKQLNEIPIEDYQEFAIVLTDRLEGDYALKEYYENSLVESRNLIKKLESSLTEEFGKKLKIKNDIINNKLGLNSTSKLDFIKKNKIKDRINESRSLLDTVKDGIKKLVDEINRLKEKVLSITKLISDADEEIKRHKYRIERVNQQVNKCGESDSKLMNEGKYNPKNDCVNKNDPALKR